MGRVEEEASGEQLKECSRLADGSPRAAGSKCGVMVVLDVAVLATLHSYSC